ncbi:MAG: methyltransferase domain-containing protein [Candidatus Hydrogenedentes bacterium]|nr:methyltransferase domain-containing protein [Candidatus Hydrogenedentota bacterium]
MSLASKLSRAFRHPDEIIPALRCLAERRHVKRVVREDGVHYLYRGEDYPEYLHTGNAASHILETARRFCSGKGLDIGANQWPFPGATPVDDRLGENAYRLDRYPDGGFDFIFSSHCLEHLARWQDALRLWIGKLRPGGVLFLYLPHESMLLWRPGGAWVGGTHKWSPTWQILLPFLQGEGMEVLEHNPGCDEYWSFHIAARRR